MAEMHAIKRLVWEALFYAALLLLLVSIVFPFFWMVKTSIETGKGLFSYPPHLMPTSYSMEGYRAVLEQTSVGLWLWNSFLVASVSTILALTAGVSCAYGLSRFSYRGKRMLALVILTTQMMPPLVLII